MVTVPYFVKEEKGDCEKELPQPLDPKFQSGSMFSSKLVLGIPGEVDIWKLNSLTPQELPCYSEPCLLIRITCIWIKVHISCTQMSGCEVEITFSAENSGLWRGGPALWYKTAC